MTSEVHLEREPSQTRRELIASLGRMWEIGDLSVDRLSPASIADQIANHVEAAIVEGVLPAGSRLPSWRDLAAQLGVARGTIRAAYGKLADRQMVATVGANGTRVIDPLPVALGATPPTSTVPQLPDFPPQLCRPLAFQMGVPAHDAFPAKVWARLHRRAVQSTALRTFSSDPRGSIELRTALASHVAIARGLICSPDQIIITTGFRSGLAMALLAIEASGEEVWVENPGYPVARLALQAVGARPIAIPVDRNGMNIDRALELAPKAKLAIVTPSQQAPTGVAMSTQRRKRLLEWTRQTRAWVIEDDYLAELQLSGRPAPALAASAGADRVIHIGTFSKTIAPMIGLGFIVIPRLLARRLLEVGSWLGTSPNAAAQLAVAEFLGEGHYLRHLRRMRRLYAQRRQAVVEALASRGCRNAKAAGLAVILRLPNGFDDQALARAAIDANLAPSPLSQWSSDNNQKTAGLILGVANALDQTTDGDCQRLLELIASAAQVVQSDCFPSTG